VPSVENLTVLKFRSINIVENAFHSLWHVLLNVLKTEPPFEFGLIFSGVGVGVQ
jgi:hypothetical protein